MLVAPHSLIRLEEFSSLVDSTGESNYKKSDLLVILHKGENLAYILPINRYQAYYRNSEKFP